LNIKDIEKTNRKQGAFWICQTADKRHEICILSHCRTIFQTVLLKQTQNGLQSRFTVKRFCKSFQRHRPT